MKSLTLLLLLLCLAADVATNTIAIAQSSSTPQGPPDVVVLKFSWSKERIGWEKDPFSPTVENYDDVRLRVRNERRLEQARRDGNRGEASRLEHLARAEKADAVNRARLDRPARYVFLYKVSLKNTGSKTITEIDWDYIFRDRATHVEVGRRQFTSAEKIDAGKGKELKVTVRQPPAATISVDELKKNELLSLAEEVILTRVVYADGNFWERP